MHAMIHRLAQLNPYQRFTFLVSTVIVIGSLVLSLAVSFVIEQFIASDTTTQTAREVEEHYRVVFGDSIFKGPLSPDEQARFFRTVKFHLDVYDIVQTKMYTPDGTIVYSYTPSQVGTSAFETTPNSPARAAAQGQRSSATVGAEALAGQIPNPPRQMLAVWIPIHRDGRVIGITEVYRNLEHTLGAVRQMQFAVSAIVALGSLMLFVSLRRIFSDSTNRIEQHVAAQRATQAQFAAIEELSRLKGEFVSLVSHELRTPLAPIIGYSEILADDTALPESARQYARIVNEQGSRLERLVNDLLELARLENSNFRIERQTVSLREIIDSNIRQLSQLSNKHTLRTDIEAGLPNIEADPDRLSQVISNLVTNAIHYSPHGGEIAINAQHVGNDVRVVVRDHGIGIPSDRRDRIFEKFYRVGDAQTRRVSGTGLGLAICHDLVQAHGGKLWVESVEGSGSSFYFTLPASSATSDVHVAPGVVA